MNRIQIAGADWEESKSLYFEIKEPCSFLELEGAEEKIREEIRHRVGPTIIKYLENHPGEFTRLQFNTNKIQEFGIDFSLTRLTVIFYKAVRFSS